MILKYESTGRIEGLRKLIQQVTSNKKTTGILILSCDKNNYTVDIVDPILKEINIPVIGGIFPSIIQGKTVLETGNIVIGLNQPVQVHVIDQLSNTNIDYEDVLDEKIPDLEHGKTMMVFVDGFAKRISAFIDNLFSVFGLDINYIGGGAGSLSMEQKPCLFTNNGLIQDSAVIGLSTSHSGIGVSHGWSVLNGPYRVTESEHNTIKSLDWQPAFDIYQEVVSAHTNQNFPADHFFEIAKSYPFGIVRINNEQIVRDPIQVNSDKSLVCVGEVPEGSFVSILTGDNNSLINAAGKAIQLGVESFPNDRRIEGILLIDCISRVLFLEDQFNLELEAVQYKNLPLVGACTLGEIANNGNEFLEFYNKTSVIAVFEK